MIEKTFNVPFIAEMALREKQIQQNYRPIIAVHKWFARRPGTLFRGLILSEFADGELAETYYQPHDLRGIRIADPFMGGGTPLIEANRAGCDIVGYDVNPMAYWIVRQEIEHLDLKAYREAAESLQESLERKLGRLYRTTCERCGSTDAHAKYFIWVKTDTCSECGERYDLFPGYLLAENVRHPNNVVVCAGCGELNEVENRSNPGLCQACDKSLKLDGIAKRSRAICPRCGSINSYIKSSKGPPRHRMFAIEYHCPSCKPNHKGRFFKKPDSEDLAKYAEAEAIWTNLTPSCVPEDEIPPGDETNRLHRWGYSKYRELFNERQLLGLELSSQLISSVNDETLRNALATNLSDLLRYQNMLCRYDKMALKSLDIFSVHGFPVGLIQCESNLLGIANGGGTNVGSGGWANIIEKYARAKAYCDSPFEIRYKNGRKTQVPVEGEWIGERRNESATLAIRNVDLRCMSSTLAEIPDKSLDAVLTDPPYFANVQYAELMDFCYVWLRKLVSDASGAFGNPTTRNENELTGNTTMERCLSHFTDGLAAVFVKMSRALKTGRPLVFTYHHNAIEAYLPIAVAMLDAGLTCSASLPCPAEMGASIHINGTGSSVIDTVFVCRSTGSVSRRTLASSSLELAKLINEDKGSLTAGGVKLSQGDIRCISYGHLIRSAVWNLRSSWNASMATQEKIKMVAAAVEKLGGWAGIEKHLDDDSPGQLALFVQERKKRYRGESDEVLF